MPSKINTPLKAYASPIAPLEDSTARLRGQLFIVAAAVAWSTAGVLQRELSVGTTTQLAGRALFAFIALFGFVAFFTGGETLTAFRTMGRAGLAVAVFTAVASGAFIVALNHASVATVLFMQALAPIAAALLAWAAFREAVTPRAGFAMAIACLGVALMVGGPDSGGAFGVTASLVITLAFAVTIVVTRHRRDVSMGPAVCLSQLLVLLAAAPFAAPGLVTARDLGLLALLGIGQMGLGLAFLTLGARLIPASEVALITLLELVLGPLWVWLAISETPAASTLMGGAVVVVAVLLQVTQRTDAQLVRASETAPDSAR